MDKKKTSDFPGLDKEIPLNPSAETPSGWHFGRPLCFSVLPSPGTRLSEVVDLSQAQPPPTQVEFSTFFFFFFQTLIKAPGCQQWIHCLLKSKIQALSGRHWLPPRAPAAHPSWMGCTGGTSTHSVAPRLLPMSSSRCGVLQSQWSCVLEPGTPRPPECLPLPPAGPQSHKWPLCSSEESWPRKAPTGLSPC